MAKDSIDVVLDRTMMRMAADSDEIERQFSGLEGAPIISVMLRLRNDAAAAMYELISVNAEDPAAIRKLQNVVRRFPEFVDTVASIYHAGRQAHQIFEEDDVDELHDLIFDSDEDRAARDQGGDEDATG